MLFLRALLPLVLCAFALLSLSRTTSASFPLSPEQKSSIDAVAEESIGPGKAPGAVIFIGDKEEITYRGVFGYREVEPRRIPMSEDTVFDLASVTKVVATTTAVMQLVEQGKIGLDERVVKYWPAFGANGKSKITVRDLLTHYSGLRADLDIRPKWRGYKKAMAKITAERPFCHPGKEYLYSDINFQVLGELVRRVSGEPLDRYCDRHIFGPLGMKDTGFRPSSALRTRTAPTQYRENRLLCGEVHDPICYLMGGVAGHAGLFSTAQDLARFARMLLNRGSLDGVKILNARTVDLMTTPASPRYGPKLRGLGWDIEPPFCTNRDDLSSGAYGHLGYTGTALWLDPGRGVFVIVLTNRVHPDGKGDVKKLRSRIKDVVSEILGPAAM